MYYLVVRQFARTLKNLDAVLEKAQAYAKARNFDVNNFLTERLAPDMLPFAAQIRIACDHAKTASASLAGKEAPKHEDNEKTFEELRGRIGKCLAYLDTFTAQDFERTTPQQIIKLARPPGKGLLADEYLFARQIPNFFFHVTTAYALLRRGGVEVGKSDFLGPLNLVDAPTA
jgi:uncharacterized protein